MGEFDLEVATLTKVMLRAKATEVVLQAYDGEVGILPSHGDFIGVLGCGVLRVTSGQTTTYMMVDGGTYRFKENKLLLLADHAQGADDIDLAAVTAEAEELAETFVNLAKFSPERYDEDREQYKRDTARIEVVKKTTAR